MFVDRIEELQFLNQILTRQRPGPAQLVLMYGRRRVGKTALLKHWIGQQAHRSTYWVAEKETASLQRRKLFAKLQNLSLIQAPSFVSWSELWQTVLPLISDRRHILVLDEVPYAAESDPAFLSSLQHAWDGLFKESNLAIVLCGSQVRFMETIQTYQSPLFGRLTGQWHLQALPFSALAEFFPSWSLEERVALYAIIGSIPAYLEWLNPAQSLVDNIKNVILFPGSLFLAEPLFLLYDEVREPQTYLSILKAIGEGHHTLNDISNYTLIGKSHLSSYLLRLQELKLVERRLPTGLSPAKQRRSRKGRYHLQDSYFRFYFRFIAPFHDMVGFETEQVLEKIRRNLRAFVGQTAFKSLAQQWVIENRHNFPFLPEQVGSHWSRHVQIDVVGISWSEKAIVLGECKWGEKAVAKSVVEDLLHRKTERFLKELPEKGLGWQVHHLLFTRVGATSAAKQRLEKEGGRVITLPQLEEGLP